MAPVVRINDATFADLKSIATWVGAKTPSETIDWVVRDAMERLDMERDEPEGVPATRGSDVVEFDGAPGLAFTKPLSAFINSKEIRNPRWSTILLMMIAQIKARGVEGEKLVRELRIPAKSEQYEEDGFTYRPELGISVQGQSASEAWKEVDRLANKWRIPVTVEFKWRENPKAKYPGRVGRLRSGGA